MKEQITILGTGQAALALAAHFMGKGLTVSLYKDPIHPGCFRYLEKNLTVDWEQYRQTYPLHLIYSTVHEAIQDSHYIFMICPSYAQAALFSQLKITLKPHQKLYIVTANFAGLYFGQDQKFRHTITDISLSPFACRFDPVKKQLMIIGKKAHLHASAYYPEETKENIAAIQPFFPSTLHPVSSILEVGLNNVNGICHPAILLLNAASLERGDRLYFNKEGVTPAVANILAALDEERCTIIKKLGVTPESFLSIMENFYGEKFSTLHDFFKNSRTLNRYPLCPKAPNGRYFDEDIGFVLLPWLNLANYFGVSGKTIESIITLSTLMIQKDFLSLGRKIKSTHLIEYFICQRQLKHFRLSLDNAPKWLDLSPLSLT